MMIVKGDVIHHLLRAAAKISGDVAWTCLEKLSLPKHSHLFFLPSHLIRVFLLLKSILILNGLHGTVDFSRRLNV
jgi:hypothetical protein